MRTVYLSAPLRAPTPYLVDINCRRAREEAELLWRLGFAVLCPHLNTYSMSGMLAHEQIFIDGDIALMKGIDCIVLMPGWAASKGCVLEMNAAFNLSMDCLFRLDPSGAPRWTPTQRDDTHKTFMHLHDNIWDKSDMRTYAKIV